MTSASKEKEEGDQLGFLIPGTLYTPICHVVLLRGNFDTTTVQAGAAMFFVGYINTMEWYRGLHGCFLLPDGQFGYFGNKSPFGECPQRYVTLFEK